MFFFFPFLLHHTATMRWRCNSHRFYCLTASCTDWVSIVQFAFLNENSHACVMHFGAHFPYPPIHAVATVRHTADDWVEVIQCEQRRKGATTAFALLATRMWRKCVLLVAATASHRAYVCSLYRRVFYFIHRNLFSWAMISLLNSNECFLRSNTSV